MAVSSYICYLEESRHTPLRGFVFIKDTVILVVCMLLYLIVRMGDESLSLFIVTVICVYLFSLILQAYTNEL